jgi:competence protein ComEA
VLELTRTQRIVLASSLALACAALVATTVARRQRAPVVVTDSQALAMPGVGHAAAAPQIVMVHVVGAVRQPGLVQLAPGSRIWDAVAAAGGFADNANTQALNLAAAVPDGVQICIPTLRPPSVPPTGLAPPVEPLVATSEPSAYPATDAAGPAAEPPQPWAGPSAPAGPTADVQPTSPPTAPASASPAGQTPPAATVARSDVRFPLSINRADAGELEALPGLGPSLAERIVRYRSANGPFQRIEDLDDVKGIGPATLAKIAPYITP